MVNRRNPLHETLMTREQRSDLSLAMVWAAFICILPANFIVAFSPLTAMIQMGVAVLVFIAALFVEPKKEKK